MLVLSWPTKMDRGMVKDTVPWLHLEIVDGLIFILLFDLSDVALQSVGFQDQDITMSQSSCR